MRELSVSENYAIVMKVEIKPPGYEDVLSRMKNPEEATLVYEGRLVYDLECICPFCGNGGAVFCYQCRTMTCCDDEATASWCAGHLGPPEMRYGLALRVLMSESGDLHGQRTVIQRGSIDVVALMRGGGGGKKAVTAEKVAENDGIRQYLADKRAGKVRQQEDKDKKQ